MAKKSKHMPEILDIFDHEFKILDHSKTVAADGTRSIESLRREFEAIIGHYEKILKQTIKITRMGDIYQKKMLLAYEQIELQRRELKEINEEIKQKNEELTEAYKKVEILARTDSLTKLSNRRDIMEKLEYEVARFERNKKPFSLVLGDIDSFKSVNDQYGHDFGDFILMSIAEIMKSLARKQDSIGRWGGEEFLILLPETSIQNGAEIAERIRETISTLPFKMNNLKFSVTMTFGVSAFDPAMSIDQCIVQADQAMYKGKRSGKNCTIMAR